MRKSWMAMIKFTYVQVVAIMLCLLSGDRNCKTSSIITHILISRISKNEQKNMS